MSKLFKLKEWLTVPDAAKHLSVLFGEEVSEADVLRLALEGHLKLSVNFVNHAKAKRGRVVSWEETEWFRDRPISKLKTKNNEKDLEHYSAIFSELEMVLDKLAVNGKEEVFENGISSEIPPLNKLINELSENEKEYKEQDYFLNIKSSQKIPEKLQALFNEMSMAERLIEQFLQQTCFMKSLKIDERRYLNLDEVIMTISGVWDLSMIGNECLDVEDAYQNLTDGPTVTLTKFMAGCYVERTDDQIYELQENIGFYENDFKIDQLGSKAHQAWLKTVGEEKLGKTETEKLLKQHDEERKKFLRGKTVEKSYFPADRLPHDSVLVVRTNALREFEQYVANLDEVHIESNKERIAKPESTRKTENLLRVLTAIAIDAYGYDPNAEKSDIPQEIADVIKERGAELDPKTIRKYLKEGVALLNTSPRTDQPI